MEHRDIIEWLIERAEADLKRRCKPDDPEWNDLETARQELLNKPPPMSHPYDSPGIRQEWF